MKRSLFIGTVLLLAVNSCENIYEDIDPGIFFKISNGLEYKYSDIELYDSATCILYFKTIHKEFKDIDKASFAFLDNGDAIYSGTFWPAYLNSIPKGPFISPPEAEEECYSLRIENLNYNQSDQRNNPRMISVLKAHNLLHSGLDVSTNNIDINGTQLTFGFTVKNKDQSDLLILDPNKTGLNLFHYFTIGLNIRDLAHNEVFYSNIISLSPEPPDSWKSEWLTELKSGDSIHFTINYTLNNPINPGEYNINFDFPGLAYQVKHNQLYQNGARIWLGDVQLTKRIAITDY